MLSNVNAEKFLQSHSCEKLGQKHDFLSLQPCSIKTKKKAKNKQTNKQIKHDKNVKIDSSAHFSKLGKGGIQMTLTFEVGQLKLPSYETSLVMWE